MDFSSRILLSTVGFTAMSLSLSACTGAPAPCTEPETAPQETSQSVSAISGSEPSVAEVASSSSKAEPAIVSITQTAEPIQSSSSRSVAVERQETASSSSATVTIDPYTAFPAMANEVFAYADSIYRQGNVDEAIAYLQRFRIIKPLWNQWESQADSMLAEFGKSNAEKAKQFEPMVLEIQNMNRAQAAYSLVSEAVDSLIAKAPGDSLVNWATAQKQSAYTNTLNKAKKEFEQIKDLANNQAKFAEALQKGEEFLLRYRDFAETLRIQEFIDTIRNMSESADSSAIKYWESHDPAEALARAKELAEKNKYDEAKELLNKLKVSRLRKEAMEEYGKLADTYCNSQRKITSQLFGKSQKQKDPAKKAALLQQAIEPLEKCLSEYPDNSQKQKVIDNKNFLLKELEK